MTMRELVLLTVVVVYIEVSIAHQGRVPLWLSKELGLLKSDAEANVKSSQFILERIENSILRSRTLGAQDEFQFPLKASYPKTCKEALKHSYSKAGWKTIDPDGSQGATPPFMVRCDMNGNEIITEFGFSNTHWTERFEGSQVCYNHYGYGVPGTADYCPETKTSVPYFLSRQQILSAIHVSGNCSQRIRWSCHGNSLLYVKPYGGKMLAYGRYLENTKYFSQGICECGRSSTCLQHGKLCNCDTADAAPEAWHMDTIDITNKSLLPIIEVVFGDLAGSREMAQLQMSTIVCRG